MKSISTQPWAGEESRASTITRWIAALLVPFLVTAAVLLLVWPDDTANRFAWPINPPLTALLMGAGYLSGAYFFTRLALSERWTPVALGLLPVAAFAWLSGLLTLLHWDRFNREHITFITWATLYALTPFIVPAMWFANRRAWDSPGKAELRISPVPRTVLWVVGGLIAFTGLLLFIAPEAWAATWPWQISPLTGRVLGSWFILSGLTDVLMGLDGRWRAVRIVLESQLIGMAGILVGFLRAWSDLSLANPLAPGFVAFMTAFFIFLAGLYLAMRSRAAQPA